MSFPVARLCFLSNSSSLSITVEFMPNIFFKIMQLIPKPPPTSKISKLFRSILVLLILSKIKSISDSVYKKRPALC